MEGLEFSVAATETGFLDLFRSYLGTFRVHEGPEAILYQADCGCPKVLPGGKILKGTSHLYVGSLRIFSGPRWENMAGRLIGSLRDMATANSNEFIRLRAAGVVVDGEALILPSVPDPHLPAIAALLVRAGAEYLGDEIVNLDPVLRRIHGIRLPILLDASDLKYFSDLSDERAPRQPRRVGADPGRPDARTLRRPVTLEELGGRRGSPAPVGRIVFPSVRPGATPALEPVTKAEGAFRLMEAVLNSHIWTDRALIVIRELVETVPVARLVIESPPEAVDLLMDPARHAAFPW